MKDDISVDEQIAVMRYNQVVYMERMKCSYWDYMNTPVDFISDVVKILWMIDEKNNPSKKRL